MTNHHVWNNSLASEVILLNKRYFQFSNHADLLPHDILREIFLFLPTNSYGSLTCVCREWCHVLTANEIWRYLFIMKFVMSNSLQPLPQLPSSVTFVTNGTLNIGSISPRPKSASGANVIRGYIDLFRMRLDDPVIGDKVEVAWRGKFRLETQDVYQGLAWWCAEIVDKHRTQYKIHYPGWESRWDEWVPKSRLRWAVRTNIIEQIYVGDIVELWCCGTNVPGAWLESKVKKIKNGKYCLGKVLSSGYLWIERDRLRLVKRGTNGQQQQDAQRSGRGRRQSGDGEGDGEDDDEEESTNKPFSWMINGVRENVCTIC